MEVWLMHHWKAVSGGWLIPTALWLSRHFRIRRLILESETCTFEYKTPETRTSQDTTRKPKSKR